MDVRQGESNPEAQLLSSHRWIASRFRLGAVSAPTRAAAPQLVMLFAVIVGAILRFFNLTGVPPGFNQDEAVNGYDAWSLFLTGRDHLGHPFPFAGLESFGDWVSPLLTFLTAPVVGILGLHVWTVRSVPALLGVLAIPLVYALTNELFQRPWASVLAAWYIAVSPWHVHRSRFAVPPAIVPTMVALTMLTLLWAIRRHSSRGLVAVGVVSALTVLSYPTMKLYIPVLLLAALGIYRRELLKMDRESILYAFVLFIVIAGPALYVSIADPGGRARFEQVSALKSRHLSPLFLARQYESYFSGRTLFISSNGHPGETPTPPGYGIELRSTVPFLAIGIIWLLALVARSSTRRERQSALMLLGALALYPLPGALTVPTYPPYVGADMSRATHVIPLLAIVAAVGTFASMRWIKTMLERFSVRTGHIVWSVLAIFVAGSFTYELAIRYNYYFNSYMYKANVLSYFQYGMQQWVQYVRLHEAAYNTIWITPYNQPYIFVLFYNQWSPNDVHQRLILARNPPAFNRVLTLGRYHFDSPPRAFTNHLHVLTTIYDPGGRPEYEVLGGRTKYGGRIMWIRKP